MLLNIKAIPKYIPFLVAERTLGHVFLYLAHLCPPKPPVLNEIRVWESLNHMDWIPGLL
jgi:hypothetical protein